MTSREAKTIDRFIQYADRRRRRWRWTDSGLEIKGEFAERVGCFVGAGLGGVSTIEATCTDAAGEGAAARHLAVLRPDDHRQPGARAALDPVRRQGAEHVARVGLLDRRARDRRGRARVIQRGDADAMICGGAEATITPLGVGGFNAMRALSTRNDAPQQASRPFDKDRDGFVIAEGAGIVVLEELEHAKKRGAKIYAEVTGYAAQRRRAPHHGAGARRRGRPALHAARAQGRQADARGHRLHQRARHLDEGRTTPPRRMAVKKVFGDARAQGDGQLDQVDDRPHAGRGRRGRDRDLRAGVARGVMPPTINYTTPDPECDLDYVPNTAREVRVQHALSNSFGFGGTNACLVLSRL